MIRLVALLLLLLSGCGTITLERRQDTGPDPTGLCDHFLDEVLSECNENFPVVACVEECVAEGGDSEGKHADYQLCVHPPVGDAPSGCKGVRDCLSSSGLECADPA